MGIVIPNAGGHLLDAHAPVPEQIAGRVQAQMDDVFRGGHAGTLLEYRDVPGIAERFHFGQIGDVDLLKHLSAR